MTQSLSGLTGVSTPGIVGMVKPEWEIPGHGITDRLRGFLMRVDAGESGLNAAEDMPPEVVDEFRRMVNAGILKPKNEAALNYARAQGGMQAGDMSLLGPMIDGMPEGLTPEYWAVVINKAQQVAQERLAIMNETGYFEGVPTMDRTRMEADITNQIAQTEIQRRLADDTIRSTDLDEAYRRDAMAQEMRQNIIDQFGYDPGPQGAMGIASGNQQASVAGADGQMTPPIPGSNGPGMPGSPGGTAQAPNMTMKMGEQVGWQYVPGSGWQQTLAGQQQDLSEQQQAFTQQAEAARAASNPRDYIYAQMLGNSRGGLNGMPATNQLTPTTQTPQTWQQQTLPGAQIGQNVANFLPGGQGTPEQMTAQIQAAQQAKAAAIANGTFQNQPADGQMSPEMFMLQQGQPAPPASYLAAQAAEQTPEFQALAQQYQQAGMSGDTATAQRLAAQMDQMRQQPQGPAPGTQNLGQPGAMTMQAQGFQAPGTAGAGMQGMATPQRLPGQQMAGGVPQQTAANQVGISAFANALNKNRLVPGSGAMNTQGAFRTMQQIGQETNPQKWRAQDFMRGNTSERQGALGTASAAGFSDEDTQDMMKKSLPTFKAPGAGAMV